MKLIGRLLVLFMLALTPTLAAAQALPASTPAEGGAAVELDFTDATSFASGFNSPAVFTDQRGNPVMAVTVTSIDRDWEHPDDGYYTPTVGKDYVAVNMLVTNMSSRPAVFSIYTVTLIDNLGTGETFAWIGSADGIWADDVTVAGDETVAGTIVFEMWSDLEPTVLMWNPDYSTYVIVYLGEQ